MDPTLEQLQSQLAEAARELAAADPFREEYPDYHQRLVDRWTAASDDLNNALREAAAESTQSSEEHDWCFSEADEEADQQHPEPIADDRRRPVSGVGGTVVIRRRVGPGGGREWDRQHPPVEGEQLQGFPIGIRETTSARGLTTYRYSVRVGHRSYLLKHSGAGWGIMYGGRTTQAALELATEQAAQEFEEDGRPYRAAAARSYLIAAGHEGGVSAINTWDNKDFTLGGGFAAERASRVLAAMRGSPAEELIDGISYFRGLSYNGSRDIRLDITALDQLVQIVESPQCARDFARAQTREFVRASAMRPGTNEAAANRIADAPHVTIGIAAYLCHGRPAFTPDPPADVRVAVTAFPGDAHRQVAAIAKMHVQRLARLRPTTAAYRNNVAAALQRRLPNKFVRVAHVSGAPFDYAAAHTVIPCLRAEPPHSSTRAWTGSAAAPSGLFLRFHSQFYDFGPPLDLPESTA